MGACLHMKEFCRASDKGNTMGHVTNFARAIFVLWLTQAVAGAQVQTTQPFPNVTYTHETRTEPAMELHAVQIDLTAPGVSLHVARGGTPEMPYTSILQPVTTMARRDGLDIAVNANFFSGRDSYELFGQKMKYVLGSPAVVAGPAMSDGKLWSVGDGQAHTSLIVDENGKVRIGTFDKFPAGCRQIVSGFPLLLNEGKPVVYKDAPAPRTAVGIDKEGKTLTLLVVDGRRPNYSAGLTHAEMARELLRLGCFNAINLDGGGSSTLVMRDGDSGNWKVMNRPSDGSQLGVPLSVERPVACALGVRVGKN